MARQSSKKGQTLGHRDITRARVAFRFLDSSTALNTDYIYDHFYKGSVTKTSLHKTLKRDRDELASEGIYLVEEQDGTAKKWRLDEQRTRSDKILSKRPAIPSDDELLARGFTKSDIDKLKIIEEYEKNLDDAACIYATLMRALLDDPQTTNPRDLGFAIARLALGTGRGTGGVAPQKAPSEGGRHLSYFTKARYERKPIKMMYRAKADDAPIERVLKVYGLFTFQDGIYVVGSRSKKDEADSIRTFNLERVEGEPIILEDEPTYEIPADFSVDKYRKLPFEIGPGDSEGRSINVTFYFQRGVKESLPDRIKKRDSFKTHQGGSAELTLDGVRDIDRAARWAITIGAIPLDPPELVSKWEELLEEARS